MSAQVDAATAAEAYARCEAITRKRAANFYYGIRLLPASKRRAISAVYAFARRIDDIGDGALEREAKLELLAREEHALRELEVAPGPTAGRGRRAPGGRGSAPGDSVIVALADARDRFGLPLGALSELIEGVRMDVEGARFEHFEELVGYCRHVAGTIGRLCVAIFGAGEGAERARADELADELGVALQLTNILRDVREDAQQGRVYVPAEDLRRFALPAEEPASLALLARGDGQSEALASLVRFEAARARGWFERGLELATLLDRRSAACVLAMAGIYRDVLRRIEEDPGRALVTRTSLSPWAKAWVAARSLRAAFTMRAHARRAKAPTGDALHGSG